MGNAVLGIARADRARLRSSACPIGVGAGVYLAEVGRGRLARRGALHRRRARRRPLDHDRRLRLRLRGRADAAASRRIAGAIALAVVMIPTVTRTTEELLRLVPAAPARGRRSALGVPAWRTTLFVVLRTALPGIATGVMLAVARIAGETAPLLFTAFNNRYASVALDRPDRLAPGADLHLRHLALRGLAGPGLDGRARPGRAGPRPQPQRAARRLAARGAAPASTTTRSTPHAGRASRSSSRAARRRARPRAGASSRSAASHACFGGFQAVQGHRPATSPTRQVTAIIGPSGLRQVDLPPLPEPDARAHAGRARRRARCVLDGVDIYDRAVDPVRAPPPRGHGLPEAEPLPDHVDPRQRARRPPPERLPRQGRRPSSSSATSARSRSGTR